MIHHYYADCLRKAQTMVQDETLAQDLTQVALIQAYRCLNTLRDPSRFKYWLLGIVQNICRNYLREKRHHFLSMDNLLLQPDKSSQEEVAREVSEIVLTSIRSLEVNYQEVMIAFYYDGLPLTSIAEQQGISLSAAKVRLHRARQLLKEKLKTYKVLSYYYREPPTTNTMKQLTIADIYLKEFGDAGILLQTEDGAHFLPVMVGHPEAKAIFLGMQQHNFSTLRPWTHDLTATLLTATGAILNSICIHKLVNGVFYAYLSLKKGKKTLKIDARPSDAIAIAVRLKTPIYVSDTLLAKAGIPVPDLYRGTQPKGKGLNQLVRVFARDKAHQITWDTWKQRDQTPPVPKESKFDKRNEQLLNLAFGEEDLPEVRARWLPVRYTTWVEALKAPDQVKWLDLTNQDLTDFAEKIKPLKQVMGLELSEKGLVELPVGIEHLKKLERLNVSGNQLTDLPASLSQLSRLSDLDVSDNHFRTLPTVVAQLPTLQKLDVSGNPSLDFSQALQSLSQAKFLYNLTLGSNNLSLLPEEIVRLAYLEILVLPDNPSLDFSQLFGVLSQIRTLHTVGLQRQQLVSFPDNITSVQQLVWLNLNDNPALDPIRLFQQLHQLKNLKVLTLMRCNLTTLPEELSLLNGLEVLEVGGNNFSEEQKQRIKDRLPSTTVVF